MINLKYRLTEEDAVKYYQMIGMKAKETRITRLIAVIWGPALLTALLIAFKPQGSVLRIIITVFLSLLWAVLLAPRLFSEITANVARKKIQKENFQFKDIELKLSNDELYVSGEKKKPNNFVTYHDLMIVAFDDGTSVIIPEHAFEGNQQIMEALMTYLVRNADKQENKDKQSIR